jgi:hypothetical protein
MYSEEWIKKKNILLLRTVITGYRELKINENVSYATGWMLVVLYLSH